MDVGGREVRPRRPFPRTSTALAVGGVISLSLASVAIVALSRSSPASTDTRPRAMPTRTSPPASSRVAVRTSRDALSDGELAAYLAKTDVQRLPFDSMIITIKTCLGRSEDAIRPCLDAGSRDQACETDAAQCAAAAEQAWQLHIEHYLRLLGAKVPAASSTRGQQTWTAYVDAECTFESSIYPDDAVMRNTVLTTCRAGKAQERALELRDSLINAES